MTKAIVAGLMAATRRTVPQGAIASPPPPVEPPPSGGVAGNVILTNAAGPTVPGVPVVTGVPFPVGTLYSLPELRLENPTTNVQKDAQFNELAKWPDGSLKSVQVLFSEDVSASATTHRLVYGPGTSRAANAVSISASTVSGVTTVTDGTNTYTFDAKGNLSSTSGAIETSYLELTEAAGTARVFDTVNPTTNSLVIEENGPTRVVIRVEGTLRSSGGVNYCQFLTRWYIYAGTGVIDIEDTPIDRTSTANENNGIPLTLSHASRMFTRKFTYSVDGTAQCRFGLESAGMSAANISGEHYLWQDGDWPYVRNVGVPAPGHTFAYSGVATGQFAPGFMNIQGSTGNKRVGVFVKHMWQQFPMELNINTNTFEIRYFTRRGVSSWDTTAPSNPQFVGENYVRPNSLYMRSSGIAKTYRARLHLHPSARSDAQLHAENDLFQRLDLECMAPQAWYFNSRVWGKLSAQNAAASTGQIAWLFQSKIAPNYLPTPTQSGGQGGTSGQAGNGTVYGWRDWGDRARVDNPTPNFQQDTHWGGGQLMQVFFMTGDKRAWDIPKLATWHYLDIDLRHNPCIPYAGYGAPASNAPAGGTRYAGHTVLDHEGDHDFSEHYHVSGMPDLYLITGDKRSKDSLTETANWLKYMSTYIFKMPFAYNDRFRESDRYYGYPIIGAAEIVRATSDWDYHKDVSCRMVNYMLGWAKTDSPHFGFNPATGTIVYGASPSPLEWPTGTPIGYNRWTEGTAAWACQRADNSYGGAGNYTTGTSPWFTMPTLTGIIKVLDQEDAFVAAGKAPQLNRNDINMMLFQILKYVITFCYEDTAYGGAGGFCYSEAARPPSFTTPGDSAGSVHNTLGVYPMLRIEKRYSEELAAGRISNPGWFTAWFTKLQTLNQKYATMMRTTSATANTEANALYGYEFPHENEYWALAVEMGYMP